MAPGDTAALSTHGVWVGIPRGGQRGGCRRRCITAPWEEWEPGSWVEPVGAEPFQPGAVLPAGRIPGRRSRAARRVDETSPKPAVFHPGAGAVMQGWLPREGAQAPVIPGPCHPPNSASIPRGSCSDSSDRVCIRSGKGSDDSRPVPSGSGSSLLPA